ncbi:family 78 glycoside hydrolase catalytic domain [Sphingobacterium sp. DN00404]|uniref:alpha-L-rhamnosidase n=2 Tax=Sphingobacterium micropteri TaxID=2763501 RepID=A0ABR7YUF7_9SPHI|nr:family 78 glycoside hydrolase catalytic domain [Sphingobacterium micropteri]
MKALKIYQSIFFHLFITFIFIGVSSCSASKKLCVEQVLIEGRKNPMGTNTLIPSFSWKLGSKGYNVVQTAYRIRVSSNADLSKQQDILWDSNWVSTDQALYNRYEGQDLLAGTTYYAGVEVKDNQGNVAKSIVQSFHTGLLTEADWDGAQWITKEKLPDSLVNPLPLSSSKLRIDKNYELPVFRKNIETGKKVISSIGYISGLGHYELLLNAQPVDSAVLQPGWTKYDKEAYYVVYDLTEHWHNGKNTIAVMLGNGFYYIPPIKGRYQKHKVAFGLPKMKMKVVNRYDDGTQETIVSDASWKVHRSPLTFSSMYGGEDYDEHVLPVNWNAPDFDDATWDNALLVDGPSLRVQETEPVRIIERFAPKSVNHIEKNIVMYDFGQNASGIVHVTMKGHQGDTVRIYPAELLTDKGRANQKHTGSPYYYEYVFAQDGEASWRPRFTYYGFRYAEVRLLPAGEQDIQIQEITAEHIRNGARQIGSFQSSDTLFNQVHTLINWGIKSNMVSVFTDCPHREKLGWLEQLHLMGPSVHYNFDAERLFAKSLSDMRQSQTKEGLVPETAPEYVHFDWGGDVFRDSPEWGSSSILLAWYAYQWYGNKALLRDNYEMMKKYMHYLQGKAKDNVLYHGLGDWYDLGPERPGFSQLTTPGITATAIYYYNLKTMSQIADLLEDSAYKTYADSLQQEVYRAFNDTFYNEDAGIYGSGSQTALAMPLYMGLVDEVDKDKVLANLIKDIVDRDTSFTAGDIGHRYLLQVLQQAGRDDLIYAMHNDDTRPGYGYQIRQGATALTESWAALPTVSNNHFMLGHLMEWFHTRLGGLGQEEGSIAYKHIRIAPKMLDVVKQRAVAYESPYGTVKFEQKQDGFHVEVPVNSKCTLVLPTSSDYQINGEKLAAYEHRLTDEGTEIQLGSGIYDIK